MNTTLTAPSTAPGAPNPVDSSKFPMRRGTLAAQLAKEQMSSGPPVPFQKAQVQTIREVEASGTLNYPKNEKLTALANQVMLMAEKFQEAQKAREEFRRMLDERHQEVLRQIANTREYIQAEIKRMTDTLTAFQKKFETELADTKAELENRMDVKFDEVHQTLTAHSGRMDNLHEEIERERADRIKAMEENVTPLQAQINKLNEGLEAEKRARQDGIEDISVIVKRNFEDCKALIEKERYILELNQVKQAKETAEAIDRLTKRQQAMENATADRIRALAVDLQAETVDRGGCQDNIVDNMSSFMKALAENVD
uniref:SF-assemblin n=1 Tax=Chromera velia CCMP2878 TaxID=1169474 RepID=A0A0G4GIG6_9ALVE|eukprot:Cvel_4756.t1-p1 / transcript=Cvel_4756.t1 / gene=Cvel_4756 / organism=Chromera_velia_CCMP2878 / gene_product=SF-assemblin, putative / transcript_product=SF-assemblin, putative / location=Cvel_scaffold212:29337-30269(+) / protein_length=311 / sequence_SO=supercontig / SO=protein_coding / is_pseudo=false